MEVVTQRERGVGRRNGGRAKQADATWGAAVELPSFGSLDDRRNLLGLECMSPALDGRAVLIHTAVAALGAMRTTSATITSPPPLPVGSPCHVHHSSEEAGVRQAVSPKRTSGRALRTTPPCRTRAARRRRAAELARARRRVECRGSRRARPRRRGTRRFARNVWRWSMESLHLPIFSAPHGERVV
jgi:hypothetical protein